MFKWFSHSDDRLLSYLKLDQNQANDRLKKLGFVRAMWLFALFAETILMIFVLGFILLFPLLVGIKHDIGVMFGALGMFLGFLALSLINYFVIEMEIQQIKLAGFLRSALG